MIQRVVQWCNWDADGEMFSVPMIAAPRGYLVSATPMDKRACTLYSITPAAVEMYLVNGSILCPTRDEAVEADLTVDRPKRRGKS